MENKNIAPALVRIKGIRKLDELEDVYCLGTNNGNFIANGMIIKNCDALRYLCASGFPSGQLSHPDENITHDMLMKKVFMDNEQIILNPNATYM